MGGFFKLSAAAAVAATAVAVAAATKPTVMVHDVAAAAGVPKATASPSPHPALVGVDPVCRVATKRCCWTPYVCGVAHRTEELTVVVDCHKAVLVETSCELPTLPHGMHEVVEETVGQAPAGEAPAGAADLDATERLNGGHKPTKCYEHKKVAHTCHKPVTVTKAYPKVCYKKACVKAVEPKGWKAPSRYVALQFGVEVPQAGHHQW